MRKIIALVVAAAVVSLFLPVGAGAADSAKDILEATGIKGGLVVHLGCGDGKLTAALHAGDSYLVHGLDADAGNVAKAREHIRSMGLHGKVWVDRLTAARLPYVDNLVNLVVAEDLGPGAPGMTEVMRVLVPNGVAFIKSDGKWRSRVKPRPNQIDEWTHFLYDASNNAVAHDTVVGPPRRLQWKAGPTFARHHDTLASISAVVSAGGRIFYVIDEGPTSLMSLPAKWRLVARDAFNGVLLWKRPIATWADYLRAFRSGPPQLPRHLVAAGQRVYVTLGLNAPITQLDAATGAILKTYKGTEGTDEILLHDGRLLLVTVDPKASQDAASAGRRGVAPARSPRCLLAVDVDSGQVLWRKSGAETAGLRPATLAAGLGRAVFQCAREVRCVDAKTGKALWRRDLTPGSDAGADKTRKAKAEAPNKPAKRPRRPRRKSGGGGSFYAPTLVVSSDHNVVLSADAGTLTALDYQTGKVLWSCRCPPDFRAPADVFLADGLVWVGLFGTQGRDPRTGKIKRTLDITGLITGGHHPRCYRNKATNRYIISGKRGMEFFDLKSGAHSRNNWARGTCQYGVLPCNGLSYLPPNACCCYAGAMLHGFYALAPERKANVAADDGPRLEPGPAQKQIVNRKSEIDNRQDWPTLRGNGTRGGSTPAPVGVSLAKVWKAALGAKLSAPVVGAGKVVVSSVHLGRITALNAGTGKVAWTFAAGGRVDSPPTIYKGLVLFGCADGWVYCLRVSDGRLVWRFRAAPQDRRVVVDEQLESVWPVHGNILVMGGPSTGSGQAVAYLAAGRSCYLDGGIYLYGLDPSTGKKLHEARVVIPHAQDKSKAFVMAGVRPDVLVSDGKYIYLQQIKFDRRLVRQKGLGRHLMNHSGLTDDTWFYRTFWRLGYGDAYDFPNSYIKYDLRVPFGQLLVFDDRTVCGLQTHFSPGISPGAVRTSSRGCLLFGDTNKPFTPDKKTPGEADYPPKTKRPKGPGPHKWTVKLPFQARAMVMANPSTKLAASPSTKLAAGKTLFVAGWPDVIDPKDPFAAIEGRKGGVLWVFAAADGKKLAEHKLDSPPVFDGLIAAGGALYVSCKNGSVVCLGGNPRVYSPGAKW